MESKNARNQCIHLGILVKTCLHHLSNQRQDANEEKVSEQQAIHHIVELSFVRLESCVSQDHCCTVYQNKDTQLSAMPKQETREEGQPVNEMQTSEETTVVFETALKGIYNWLEFIHKQNFVDGSDKERLCQTTE